MTSTDIYLLSPHWKMCCERKREKGLVNSYIPAISVDEGKNAMLANQSLKNTNLQEVLCHNFVVMVY